MPEVHSTAIVHPDAVLADDVEVGPYALVEKGTEIGPGSKIQAHAVVLEGTRMGRDNLVGHHVVLGGEPQDVKFDGRPTGLVIGDGNRFREFVNVHRATGEENATRIGNGCYLMTAAHVAHDCHLENEVVIATGTALAGHVSIGDQVFVSGNCVIHQYVRMGRNSFAGGLSTMGLDVPPFTTVGGNRPSYLYGLNVVGLRRAGFKKDVRDALKSAFTAVFQTGIYSEALADHLSRDDIFPEVREMLEFCQESRRGVAKGLLKSRSSEAAQSFES